jgi:hypothetical protein
VLASAIVDVIQVRVAGVEMKNKGMNMMHAPQKMEAYLFFNAPPTDEVINEKGCNA